MKIKYYIVDIHDDSRIITTESKNDYEKLLENYDKTKGNKLKFLNELYGTESTIKNMWSIYNNHIAEHEIELEKDIMFFNNLEVDEVIANRFMFSPPTKDAIINFIAKYKDWGVSKKQILNNNIKALDRKNTTRSMSNVLMNKVWGLGEFYNLLVKIEQTSVLGNAIPLLLARYGIIGKELLEMRQLKWEDIDYEKRQVRIVEQGKSPRILDVDNRFIQWIDKYRTNLDTDEEDYGYVLKKPKKNQSDDNLLMSRHTIDSKIYRACDDAKITRISIGDLLKSRYMDYLLDIRKERKLSVDDFEWVQLNFKEVLSRQITISMIEFYESLTKDKIVLRNNSRRLMGSLKDPASEQVVKDIIEAIEYQEFINGETNFKNDSINNSDEISATLEEVATTEYND
jgi:site-specific recombinase XerD